MNPNNTDNSKRVYSGFSLPEGYKWKRSYQGGMIKSAIVLDLKGKVYAKLHYSEGKLNGLCEFFENGVLKEKRTYINDVANGWACTIENGKEKQWLLYKDGLCISSIGDEDNEGYREEVSLETGKIVTKCKYDPNHKPIGTGYLYDDGVISKEVDVESGKVLKDYKKDNEPEKLSEITDISVLVEKVKTETLFKGYVVLAGYAYKPRYVDGKLEGTVIVYDDKKHMIAKLLYHNNLLEGVSEFYKDGALNELRSYKQNYADGWGCMVENGQESVWFTYKHGNRVAVLAKLGDTPFRREIDLSSGATISIAQYNENRQVHGLCYKFINGMIEKISMYVNGNETAISKSFEGDVMSEFSDTHLAYKGQYKALSEVQYVRENTGREFVDGGNVYFGEWNMDKREGKGCSYSRGHILYSGYWKEGLPDGEGELLDENGNVVKKGIWKKGVLMGEPSFEYSTKLECVEKPAEPEETQPPVVNQLSESTVSTKPTIQKVVNPVKSFISDVMKKPLHWKSLVFYLCVICVLLLLTGGIILIVQASNTDKVYVINSKKEFDKLKNSVRYVQFPANSCNEDDFTSLDFSRFTKLESVVVSNDCFKHVKKVTVANLNNLKRLQIGRNAFTSQSSVSILGQPLNVDSKEFVVKDCRSLSSVEMGPYAFSDYSSIDMESSAMTL